MSRDYERGGGRRPRPVVATMPPGVAAVAAWLMFAGALVGWLVDGFPWGVLVVAVVATALAYRSAKKHSS